jgi:hypothetical protein
LLHKSTSFQAPLAPFQLIHHFSELLGDNVLLDEELLLLHVVAFIVDKVSVDAPVFKAFGSFQKGVVCRVDTCEHLTHPVGERFNWWVSVVWLSIDGCDIGGFICLSPSQHLHLPISLLSDPDGDHLVSSAGGDGVDDVSLIVYVSLWDRDFFSLLAMDLAHEVHNQLA